MRFRPSSLEIILLAALLVTTGVWTALTLSVKRSRPAAEQPTRRLGSTWAQQEREAKERLRSASMLDRAALERKIQAHPGLYRQFQIASFGLFLLMLAGALGLVRALIRFFNGQPIIQPLGSPPPPGWGLRQILRLVLAIFLLAQAALLIQGLLFRITRPGGLDRHLLALGNTLFLDIVTMVGAGYLLFRAGGPVRSGFVNGKWRQSVRFAVASYVTALPLLGLIVLGVAMVLERLSVEPTPQAVFTFYMTESRAPVLSWMLVLITVIGPVAEELFFRGLLYGWLRTRIGVVRGLGLSALLFAGLHGNAIVFFPIFFLGLLFGWVYERTGSLIAPVAIHVFHNSGMLFLASLVKSVTVQG